MKKYTRLLTLTTLAPAIMLYSTSCNKNDITTKKDDSRPDVSILADSSIYAVTMTPSDICDPVLDDTDEDHKHYCVYYQLADALRENMTDEILDYIYTTQLYKMANLSETEAPTIYYEDLFLEFPTLEANMNNYLSATDYGLTYEYDNYSSMAAVFTEEELAVWIPNIELLPTAYDPDINNYIIAAPIQIDLEDLDSEDRIFAWEYTEGNVATISLGETASGSVADRPGASAKGTYVTGKSRSKGTTLDPPTPYISTTPPYSTSNPWGYGHGGKINRIKINARYDRNKYSEVRLCIMWGKYDGTLDGASNINTYLSDVHRNDVGTDRWITPVWLFNMVDNTEDRVFIYNMYERDWFFIGTNLYQVGGLINTNNNWAYRMWPRMGNKYDYYLANSDDNHQKNLNERLDHPFSHSLYSNNTILNIGRSGNTLITYY